MCAAMASPSRSGSVAITIRSVFFAKDLNSFMNGFLSGSTSSTVAKSLSTSTPNSFLGKSFIWPTLAMTSYTPPRYFEMVFALEGDSTIKIGFELIVSLFFSNQLQCRNIARVY